MLLFGVSLRLDDQVILLSGAVEHLAAGTAELRSLGANLLVDGTSGLRGQALVEEALRTHGRIDGLVHALAPGSPRPLDFEAVDHHVRSLIDFYDAVQPAWTAMRERGSGRVVVVWPTGASDQDPLGRLGADQQAVAGMGAVGLVNVLKLEVGDRDLKANAVLPLTDADSATSALVGYLLHPTCALNGAVLAASTDGVRHLFIGVTPGEFNAEISTAWVADRAPEVGGASDFVVPSEGGGEMPLLKRHFG
jgi:NAD(P)-dependent dehydrogenase (short-subunit alcohol dehydrogenase family)